MLPESNKEQIETKPQIPETSDRIPSMDDLRRGLDEIFPPEPGEVHDSESDMREIPESYPKEITLDDGTVVTLPDAPSPMRNADTNKDETERSGETDANCLDDNGKLYMTDNGGLIPNNTYEIDGTEYKTDDNGQIYSVDGKLYPNDTYELNGTVYTTDDQGRIVDVQTKPILTPENSRDTDAQKDAGGEDRQEGDQGGHIVGRDMGGDGSEGNLVAMDSRINQSDYKKMENEIKRALAEGKDVSVHYKITYDGDSERPAMIKVTVTVDGKETVYTFDNNLNGALRENVSELAGKDAGEDVQNVLDKTGGEISSVKAEYGENGKLVKVTENITYTDENGKTQRTKVIIDNPQGGNTE